MFITALCPSYKRPSLLQNSLALWERQVERGEAELFILEDSGIYGSQKGEGWTLMSSGYRYPSLPEKYNAMLEHADPRTEAFVVWEDDDIYLPFYIKCYREAFMAGAELVKPAVVISDYNNFLEYEKADGRFHASLGFTRELAQRVGGWPKTKRADFDQQFIRILQDEAGVICTAPFEGQSPDSGYIFSWHTGHHHGQHSMRGADDEGWYSESAKRYPDLQYIGKLEPEMDTRTKAIFQTIWPSASL